MLKTIFTTIALSSFINVAHADFFNGSYQVTDRDGNIDCKVALDCDKNEDCRLQVSKGRVRSSFTGSVVDISPDSLEIFNEDHQMTGLIQRNDNQTFDVSVTQDNEELVSCQGLKKVK